MPAMHSNNWLVYILDLLPKTINGLEVHVKRVRD